MYRLLRRCRGNSYTLSAVIVAPMYLAVLLGAYEAAVMGIARLGTQYAAHAAVRSAVIWPDDDMPKLAAYGALAPFLGSRREPEAVSGEVSQASREYERFFGEPGLDRRFRVAATRTEIIIERPGPENPKGNVKATVKFKAPLWFPGVSRFLDPDGQAPYEFPMTATATMPNDAPVSKDGTLGIAYKPGARR